MNIPQFVLQARKRREAYWHTALDGGEIWQTIWDPGWRKMNPRRAICWMNSSSVRASEKVFVDAMKSNPWAMKLLRERGFEYSRPLMRMYRGRNDFPGRPELQGGDSGTGVWLKDYGEMTAQF